MVLKTKKIEQTIIINATPHDIYEAFMDSRKHSKFTESKAKISREIGGGFSVFEGSLEGTNKELIPDKKIVQSWRSDETDWPKKHYSTLTIELKSVKEGTEIRLTQMGVPEACYESINQGWTDYYWDPMKEMLEK